MADEIKKIITVDVSGALSSLDDMEEEVEEVGYSFRSLGDAKKYIDKLRASLIDLDEDSEEYADTVAEIDTVQEKLNKAMKVTGSTLKNAEGSYDALNKKMNELKRQFKATNDEAERQDLAKQIVTINDKLKTMDASIGNYQRNVGNYEAAFTKGLAGITSEIKSLGNPLAIAKNGVKSLGEAFKALIMNPVGAIIMAIVVAIKALKKGFEGSEEATNSLKKAFSAFQPVMNAISNVFTGFAKLVGKLAENAIPALVNALQKAGEWMMKLLNKIGIVSDEKLEAYRKSIEAQKEAIKVTQDLTEREIALEEKKRKLAVQEAKTAYEVSELRAKAANKDKYTAEQRQKFLEQAIAKERALSKTQLEVAQEEYNILKERAQLTDNNKEDNEALAQAEANLYRVKKEHYDKERKLIKELATVRGELSKDDEDALKEAEKAAEEQEKIREKELAQIQDIQKRTTLSLMESSERDLKVLKDKYEEEKALFEKYGEDTVKLTEEYNRKVDEIKASKGESSIKDIEQEATLQQYIADKTIQIEWKKKQKLLEINKGRLQDEKKAYEDLLKLENLSVEKKQEYAKQLEKINADIVENDKQSKLAEQQHLKDLVNSYTEVANGIGTLLSEISSYWQDSIKERIKTGEITEEQGKKEFEESKKLQIAQAIITGLAGVAAALASPVAMAAGPAGWIAAGVQAAAVAASTAVQVAKIKATTLEGSTPSIAAETTSPTDISTSYTPNYSTNVTGESETVNLANAVKQNQQDQRVYVVESDINEVGKRVEVRESESTF